jgi:hypothetical protein
VTDKITWAPLHRYRGAEIDGVFGPYTFEVGRVVQGETWSVLLRSPRREHIAQGHANPAAAMMAAEKFLTRELAAKP